MSKRPASAKWPVILDEVIERGELIRAIALNNPSRAYDVSKKMRDIYHADERGVTVVARNGVVYVINRVALNLEQA